MTPVIPEGLEPLAVWDADDPGWVDEHWKERIAWAGEHFDRGRDTYRVEFYLLDSPFMAIYRYAVNAEGRKYTLATQEFIADIKPVTEPLVIMPLAELPPAHLLRTP